LGNSKIKAFKEFSKVWINTLRRTRKLLIKLFYIRGVRRS